MGDRRERSRMAPLRVVRTSTKPPAEIIAWGLPRGLGHNGGPPLDPPVNDLFVQYRWRKAHREAWRNPPRSIMMFRLARAAAAGVTYEAYTAHLLDTGRHLQAGENAGVPVRGPMRSELVDTAPTGRPSDRSDGPASSQESALEAESFEEQSPITLSTENFNPSGT